MATEPSPLPARGPIRILVVDDSATIRLALVRLLRRGSAGWQVSEAANAEAGIERAVRAVESNQGFDLVLLDVEMPGMSGLQAVPVLLALRPAPRVVMVASPTRRGAEITFAALQAGASDFIPKPTSQGLSGFERELLTKVTALIPALGTTGKVPASARTPDLQPRQARLDLQPGSRTIYPVEARPRPPEPRVDTQRTVSLGLHGRPSLLAIGASTGGPAALSTVMRGLRDVDTGPIVVTQHMPAAFLPVFAEQLAACIGRPCAEAADSAPLRADRVYLAPGERHLLVERCGARLETRLDHGPPENFCRPAVDPMLRSIAKASGPTALAVILTGMGQDGAEGCASIRAAGGRVVVQDEASSIVWGMPGAVARRGLANAVLPLGDIAPAIAAAMRRTARSA